MGLEKQKACCLLGRVSHGWHDTFFFKFYHSMLLIVFYFFQFFLLCDHIIHVSWVIIRDNYRFVPNERNNLISASIIGLIYIVDANGDINDDDHLQSVSVISPYLQSFNCFLIVILLIFITIIFLSSKVLIWFYWHNWCYGGD